MLARDIDRAMPIANARADIDATSDALRASEARVAELERGLQRARRCIAELRRAKADRLREAREDQSRSDAAVRILCKRCFGDE